MLRSGKHAKRFERARLRRLAAQKPFYLNLTSMVDMFTIILVFLLGGAAVTDESFSPPKNVNLPASHSQMVPTVAVKLAISSSDITIDDKTVVRLKHGRLNDQDVQGMVIYPLFRELQQTAAKFKDQPAADRRLILYGDKSIPFGTVKRVLFTAGQAEFEGFRFSVIRKGML